MVVELPKSSSSPYHRAQALWTQTEFIWDTTAIFLRWEEGIEPPCSALASFFERTHVAKAHPGVSLGDLRVAVANYMLANKDDIAIQLAGLGGMAALTPAVKPPCSTPDAAALITASVCTWRALAAAAAAGILSPEGLESAGQKISSLIFSVVEAGLQDSPLRNDSHSSRRTSPPPAIRPGPRALAATGGSLPAELHPHVIARTVRQALLLAVRNSSEKRKERTEAHCHALIELVVVDW